MKQKIEIGVPYTERGEEYQKRVRVDFISNDVIRRYNIIAEELSDAVDLQEELQMKIEELGWIISGPGNKLEDMKRKRAEAVPIKKEMIEIKKRIKAGNHKDIMSDRFSLIETILKDNGNTDPDLFDYKFWNGKTDAATVWKFLAMAVTKDMSQGKKKVNTTSTNPS